MRYPSLRIGVRLLPHGKDTALDLSGPDRPRYAEHRGDYRQNVGSVGKLVVALALFQALADAWPDDTGQRIRVLRDTLVTADAFSQKDHHKIRIFDMENRKLTRRIMQAGDQGTLVVDRRSGEDLFHLAGQLGSDQAVGFQQVIETRALDRGYVLSRNFGYASVAPLAADRVSRARKVRTTRERL